MSINNDFTTDLSNMATEIQANVHHFLDTDSLIAMGTTNRLHSVLARRELWRRPCIRLPYPSPHGIQTMGALYNFITLVLADPVRACTIRSFSLLWRKVEEENIREVGPVASYTAPIGRNATIWSSIIIGSDILPASRLTAWAERIRQGSLDATIAFLLLHLPKLRRLTVHFDNSLSFTTEVLTALAAPPQGSPYPALNLHYLELEGSTDSGRWTSVMPIIISWFPEFPNLRHLRLIGVRMAANTLSQEQSTSLMHLDISKSSICSNNLTSIISASPKLVDIKALNVWYDDRTVFGQRYPQLNLALATCNPLNSLQLRERPRYTPSAHMVSDNINLDQISRHTSLETLRLHHRLLPHNMGSELPSSLVTLYIDMDLWPLGLDIDESSDSEDSNNSDGIGHHFTDSDLTSLDMRDLNEVSQRLDEMSKSITRFSGLRHIYVALFPPESQTEKLLSDRIKLDLFQYQTQKRLTNHGVAFGVYIESIPFEVP